MATALFWSAAALVAVLVVIWRLRRANDTVRTILSEERERTALEPARSDEVEPARPRVGRHRKPS